MLRARRSRRVDLRPRIGGPAPTIRLRLTVAYGLVFLVTGAVLLTIGYALVRHNVGGFRYRERLTQLHIAPGVLLTPRFRLTPAQVAIARDVHKQLETSALHRLLAEYLLALGVMTLLSVAAGWLLAGRALRPLRDITATARRVSSQNLGERIALSGPADELKQLADTFDGMLGRLDDAFESQRHFVANASHELRTPLAIMRTEVDVALADPDAGVPDLRAMGEAVRESIDRCERLIEGLLVLARSEAAIPYEEPIDVRALAGDCITDLRARAEESDVELWLELSPAWPHGDPRLVERLIANLIDNGIRHNVRGGRLELRTGVAAGAVELTVANGGPVIEPEVVQTLTEPFRRLERSYGSFGLGLSIVRSVAEAHGGRVELTAPASGGLVVVVRLPAIEPPPPHAAGALTGAAGAHAGAPEHRAGQGRDRADRRVT
jgi:signal transduction histidine kinase